MSTVRNSSELLLLLLLLPLQAAASGTFFNTFESTEDGITWAVAALHDGGYMFAGQTGIPGNQHICLLRTDDVGRIQSKCILDRSNINAVRDMDVTSDGSVIMTGCAGDSIFLLKTDCAGSEEWTKFYQPEGCSAAFSVCQVSDGGFVIAGATDNWKDGCVLKTDQSGNLEWLVILDGRTLQSIEPADCERYLIAGMADGSHGYTGIIDSSGNILWEMISESPTTDMSETVYCAVPCGSMFITATMHTNDSMMLEQGAIRGVDYESGVTWEYTLPLGSSIFDLYDTGHNELVATGYMDNGAGNTSVLLIKFDVDGHVIWQRTYGFLSNHWGFSVTGANDGGYVACGAFSDDSGPVGLSGIILKVDEDGLLYSEEEQGYMVAAADPAE